MNTKRDGKMYAFVLMCTVMLIATATVRGSFAADLVRIGYVDLRVALNESNEGKKAKAELESLIKTKQVAIDEKGKTVEKLKGELEKQSSVLSGEAKKAKEDEIERLLRDYQRLVQDSQAEVKKKEDKYTESIIKELREIVEKIGKEENYSLILENVEGIILYTNKDLDLTERVLKKYNELRTENKEKK
ncbi:MAG: OmpH family outer membrane protein [Thermodesulfovibrionales bacterium]|jgi:outer membrane protein